MTIQEIIQVRNDLSKIGDYIDKLHEDNKLLTEDCMRYRNRATEAEIKLMELETNES